MVTLIELPEGGEPDPLSHWRTGSAAWIVWRDEYGAVHLCVATERSWALDQLALLEREPSYRLVFWYLDRAGVSPDHLG